MQKKNEEKIVMKLFVQNDLNIYKRVYYIKINW